MRHDRTLFLQGIHRHLPLGEFNEDSFYACFPKKNSCACNADGSVFATENPTDATVCGVVVESPGKTGKLSDAG